MSVVIGDSQSLKIFAKAIQAISKIGEEIHLELFPSKLVLRTINSSRSSYCSYEFRQDFFLSLKCDTRDKYRCKIASRSAVLLFKSTQILEKNVDSCALSYDMDECLLNVVFQCKFGTEKTYNLKFSETEIIQAKFNKEKNRNLMMISAKWLNEVVGSFKVGQEEMTLCCESEDKLCLKNCVFDEKTVRTELQLKKTDFSSLQIPLKTNVTFCLKELRVALAFAEAFTLPITIRFDKPGKPAIISVERDETFCADFVLSTVSDEDDEYSQCSSDGIAEANLTPNCESNQNGNDEEIIPIYNRNDDETLENEDVLAEQESDDFGIPSAPPSKRFRKRFLGLTSSQQSFCASQMEDKRPICLVPDSDDEDNT